MRLARAALVAAGLLTSTQALAWNDRGHMMVAAVAWERLDPVVRIKVDALLRLNPMYRQWIGGAKAGSRDQIAFVRAATWADDIQDTTGYADDTAAHSGKKASQNIGYRDRLQHRYWHAAEMRFSPDGTPIALPNPPVVVHHNGLPTAVQVQPEGPNAVTAIGMLRGGLASASASNDVKSYDLVWLENLVGDIHQPLRVTSRFTRDLPQGDQGGGRVALCRAPCGDTLRALWEDALGTDDSAAAAIAAAKQLHAAPADAAGVTDETAWMNESFNLARTVVYTDPIGIGAGPFTVTPAYKAKARKVAEERVALAGARLAKLINAALK